MDDGGITPRSGDIAGSQGLCIAVEELDAAVGRVAILKNRSVAVADRGDRYIGGPVGRQCRFGRDDAGTATEALGGAGSVERRTPGDGSAIREQIAGYMAEHQVVWVHCVT